jgi:hypothetical protein
VVWSFVYLALRRVLGLVVLGGRSQRAKDLELIVLRHEIEGVAVGCAGRSCAHLTGPCLLRPASAALRELNTTTLDQRRAQPTVEVSKVGPRTPIRATEAVDTCLGTRRPVERPGPTQPGPPG